MDLVADFAQPLPAAVMAAMFGIPKQEEEAFQRWSDDIARFFGGTFGDIDQDARKANAAIVDLERLFRRLIEERRRAPEHDLMSLLIVSQEQGRLEADELTAQCILISVAGHVTTIDQLGNGVNTLLAHQDQWQKLRAQPELLPSAVEEILRHSSSVPFIHRIAREPLTIGSKRIEVGQVVFLGLAAANHDPAHFPEPERFDITRQPNKHIAFGVGPHLCLGAALSRRELEIGLASLLRRMPSLRFAEQPAELRCESLMFRGFKSLRCSSERGQKLEHLLPPPAPTPPDPSTAASPCAAALAHLPYRWVLLGTDRRQDMRRRHEERFPISLFPSRGCFLSPPGVFPQSNSWGGQIRMW
jgi:cytochrome P450 PksS